MAKSPTQITAAPLAGGLNLAQSPLSLQPGEARVLHNYVCDALGRYERIAGFTRFDGHQDVEMQPFVVLQTDVTHELETNPALDQLIQGSLSNATGTLVHYNRDELVLIDVVGDFRRGDVLPFNLGTVIQVYENASGHHVKFTQQFRKVVADHYRSMVDPVPGTGPIRGVSMLHNEVLAWRDDAQGKEVLLWKSTKDGWEMVPVVPPRQYVPPFAYDYLIYSGQSGASSYEDATDVSYIRTFKRGYFRTAPWYGELLLPSDPVAAELVREISYYHPDKDTTILRFDPGKDLGDYGQLDVFVEDTPMYQFREGMTGLTITKEGRAYLIEIDGKHELWNARQRVGFLFYDQASLPALTPTFYEWSLQGPHELEEGQELVLRITATDPHGTGQVAGLQIPWTVEGIDMSDLDSGSLSGTATTDAQGEVELRWRLTADGHNENEGLLFQGTTPEGKLLVAVVNILDVGLPADQYTYRLSGPGSFTAGETHKYFITVTDPFGTPVDGVEMEWELAQMSASHISSPISGHVVSDATGRAEVPVTLKTSAPDGTLRFQLLSPVVRSLLTPVKAKQVIPAPLPPAQPTPITTVTVNFTGADGPSGQHILSDNDDSYGWNQYTGTGESKYGSPQNLLYQGTDFAVRACVLVCAVSQPLTGISVVLTQTSTKRLANLTLTVDVRLNGTSMTLFKKGDWMLASNSARQLWFTVPTKTKMEWCLAWRKATSLSITVRSV